MANSSLSQHTGHKHQHSPQARNRFALTRAQLLEDYAQISSQRKHAAVATALRMESVQYRDILASEATRGAMDFSQLQHAVLQETMSKGCTNALVARKLAELAEVVLLQNFEVDDIDFATTALHLAIDGLPKNALSRKYRMLLVQHYITTGQDDLALAELDLYSDIDKEYLQYLRAELKNPFRDVQRPNVEEWLANFNAPFIAHGLEPVEVVQGVGTAAFDGLTSIVDSKEIPHEGTDPIVSVVMTILRPDPAAVVSSIKSILNQSITNLELIIVDDASPAEYKTIVTEIAELDPRIRSFSMPQNSGTYLARNLGYSHARGQFITGQDDDDWSHPRRLEKQLEVLQANPGWSGCRVRSITCTPDLSRVRLGYRPENPNASSLMVRATDFQQMGGFLPVRKAADTELHKRLEIVTGKTVHELAIPLTIVRIEQGSLSRSDFRSGWHHPARRQFKSAYQLWHATTSPSQLCLAEEDALQVAVPQRFLLHQSTFPKHLDVVFAGDWRSYGGPQKSMIEEIQALTRAGLNVGILHLEAPRFMSSQTKPMCAPIQEMVNNGDIQEILYDDPVAVDLLILRYPPILQFVSHSATALKIRQMLILANQAPSELDGRDIRYLVNDCHQNALEKFCSAVLWVPQGPQVREAISPYLKPDQLATYDMPGIVDLAEWKTFRTGPRGTMPVIGRHSRDDAMKWPEHKDTLSVAYLTNGDFDVRIMGGAKIPLRTLGEDHLPAAWTVYDKDELAVRNFLGMLDFFVFFQHSQAVEAFGRSIVEAIAAGVVVILPPHYEPVFGKAAIYTTAGYVPTVIKWFHQQWELYEEQLRQAQRVLKQRFSYQAYTERVFSILAEHTNYPKRVA